MERHLGIKAKGPQTMTFEAVDKQPRRQLGWRQAWLCTDSGAVAEGIRAVCLNKRDSTNLGRKLSSA